MSRRPLAVMALAMLGINAHAIQPEPEPYVPRRRERDPELLPPVQCGAHDHGGRRCERYLPHRDEHAHSHPGGWLVHVESRQVRRARARAEAKAQRRRGRQ
jgi:hypothetical protein